MIKVPEGITVKEVDGYPGWQLISDGKNRRYLSPGGKNISRARFDKLRKRAEKEQRAITEIEINASIENPLPDIDFFPEQKVSKPEDHPEASTRPSAPPPVEEEKEPIVEIIDQFPEPELSGRKTKKKVISAKEFADKLAMGLNVSTGIVATLTSVPELQMTGRYAYPIATDIAWLLDEHDMLDSQIARIIANNQEAMVWAKLGNELYQYLSVAAPAVWAKIDLMRASAEEKRARANQANQQEPYVPRQHQEQPVAVSNGNVALQAPTFGVSQGPRTPPGVR